MKLPVCQYCGEEWSFWETFKQCYNLRRLKKCPYCKQHHHISQQTRHYVGILSLIWPAPMILTSFFVSTSTSITITFTVISVVTLIIPFCLRLTRKNL
ncbi:TIGR04104 family putative zinc finger protein [Thalassobacillus hwangdonensis]|uniref:TIGR04104 family putative zinc finger protein n=1 Tax=Thalassobacillus hwangdonensis TaxID=546108 RepID=A0ABW3L4K1_9BACI